MTNEPVPSRRLIRRVAFAVAIGFSSFHLYTGAVGSLPAMQQRSVHLLFAMVLLFLLRAEVARGAGLGVAAEETGVGVGRELHMEGIGDVVGEDATLPFEAERDLSMRAAEVLDTLAGRPCVGMRTASWDFSPPMSSMALSAMTWARDFAWSCRKSLRTMAAA